MVRIAYCLLVHKNPRQVKRLLNRIYSNSDFFYVNIFNGKSSKEEWLKKIGGPRVHVNFKYGKCWAEFPVVSATIDAMQKFANCSYDYFINLSGYCYPLKSNIAIKQFLCGWKTAFMKAVKLPSPSWSRMGGLQRVVFSYYKHPLRVIRDRILNSVLGCEAYESRRFLRLPKVKRRLPCNCELYAGSAYFCLTKKHVEYILEYVKNNPKFVNFFRRSWAPDEMFFHTILLNSELKETVVNNNLRYIDWTRKGEQVGSPALLTIEDADKLLCSSALYARKFDMKRDKSILDLIDQHRASELRTKDISE